MIYLGLPRQQRGLKCWRSTTVMPSVEVRDRAQVLHGTITVYIIAQVILASWLVLAYDLLEDRRTIDVITTKFFPLCFKMAENFENLDDILDR